MQVDQLLYGFKKEGSKYVMQRIKDYSEDYYVVVAIDTYSSEYTNSIYNVGVYHANNKLEIDINGWKYFNNECFIVNNQKHKVLRLEFFNKFDNAFLIYEDELDDENGYESCLEKSMINFLETANFGDCLTSLVKYDIDLLIEATSDYQKTKQITKEDFNHIKDVVKRLHENWENITFENLEKLSIEEIITLRKRYNSANLWDYYIRNPQELKIAKQ